MKRYAFKVSVDEWNLFIYLIFYLLLANIISTLFIIKIREYVDKFNEFTFLLFAGMDRTAVFFVFALNFILAIPLFYLVDRLIDSGRCIWFSERTVRFFIALIEGFLFLETSLELYISSARLKSIDILSGTYLDYSKLRSLMYLNNYKWEKPDFLDLLYHEHKVLYDSPFLSTFDFSGYFIYIMLPSGVLLILFIKYYNLVFRDKGGYNDEEYKHYWYLGYFFDVIIRLIFGILIIISMLNMVEFTDVYEILQ